MVELHVGGHLIAEAVAALGGDLLDGGAVGTEAEGPGGQTDLALRSGGREDLAAAAVAGVDPAVGGQDEVIGDEVRVAGREAAVEHMLLVRLAVAVGVAEPDDVRLADHDHAVAVVAETRDELEPLVEDLLLVGHAVAVGVDEHADLVLGRTVVAAGHEHPALLPGLGVERTAAVGIFGRLGDPQASALVPLHRDGLVDERFRGHQRGLEAGLHLEGGGLLSRTCRTAGGIAEVDEVGRHAERVDVGEPGRPGHGALDERAVAEVGIGGGIAALQEDRGAMLAGVMQPGLRLDVVDRGARLIGGDVLAVGGDLGGERSGQDLDLLGQSEVEDRVVEQVERGGVLEHRMGAGADVQHHQIAELAALSRPAAAEDIAAPLRVAASDAAVDRHHALAGGRMGGDGVLSGLGQRLESRGVQHDDVVAGSAGKFGRRRRGGLGRRCRLQRLDQRPGDGRVVADDEHLDGSGAEDGGQEGRRQKAGEAGKHALKLGDPTPPSIPDFTPHRNPPPLKRTSALRKPVRMTAGP